MDQLGMPDRLHQMQLAGNAALLLLLCMVRNTKVRQACSGAHPQSMHQHNRPCVLVWWQAWQHVYILTLRVLPCR